MSIAAVPSYLGQDFTDASPGMRFGLFLPIWTERADQEAEVSKRAQAKSPEGQEIAHLLRTQGMEQTIAALRQRDRNPLPRLWTKNNFAARAAWDNVRKLTARDQKQMAALRQRTQALAATVPAAQCLILQAIATAPFTTGLGNEHPLENGFAFLWPYGLPYLPGSGVKGVVRRAAQELASGQWSDDGGWKGLDQPACELTVGSGKDRRTIRLSVLDVLFGREPPSGDADAVRGALSFWDVIPQINGDSLMVEIMTPHQSHYYQQKREHRAGDSVSPHDSGQPNPIAFLTVPPGSGFCFHVVCDERHLRSLTAGRQPDGPDLLEIVDGRPRWQVLLAAAFGHAFAWLGFGAKTAVGYGAMKRSPEASPDETATHGQGAAAQKPASEPAGIAPREEVWPQARLSWNPGPGELYASSGARRTAPLKGEAAQKLIAELGERANRLKRDRKLENVSVRVRAEGNMLTLLGLVQTEK